MEAIKDEVVDALHKVFKPVGILLRNDSGIRAMEGLDSYVEAIGEVPERVIVVENGVRFAAPLAGGQKTGWFYDHRENRARLMRYVAAAVEGGKPPRVLDVFSYLGGWGIQAAAAGAAEVVCVDSSAAALDGAERSAALNDVGERVKLVEGDAFDALKALKAEDERFDIVVLDPPAFIKRKKDVSAGSEAYRRINQAAMQLLGKDGLLFSASCSYHLRRDNLLDILHRTARHLDRRLQLLESGGQGPDHPIHPAIPETDYLKCFAVRVVSD
jgi:23S rRNA (cytosine1962-C5)-methyltransferase